MARYEFKFTPENIRKIEYILPKLKHSSYIANIGKWLQNFDKDEVELAIDFLMFFEYITLSELQQRLDEQLSSLYKLTPPDCNILLVPFAKYAKSNDVIAYLISKTRRYTHKKSEGRISIDRDYEKYNYDKKTVLVFLDDFIGTGDSFVKAYDLQQIEAFIESNEMIEKEIYLLAAIVMNKGLDTLTKKIPNLTVLAELRYNNFHKENSPFVISQGPDKMKSLALKYGEAMVILKRDGKDIFYPLGYGECEALVSFDYGPPNNTLPIIWSSHNKWHPIFPRLADDKINQAKEIKKSVAFFIGVMKMLRLIIDEKEIIIDGRKYQYDPRRDHSLLTVIYLLRKRYNEVLICQIIGLTMQELYKIYEHGKSRRLLDSKNQLTHIGNKFIGELIQSVKKQTFRSNKRENFEINNVIYVPKEFQGNA